MPMFGLCLMRKSPLTSIACTKEVYNAGAGAMGHWPALDRWQHPEYLLAVAGQRTVPIELGKHYLEEGWGQSLVSLGDFMARHIMPAGASPLHLDLLYMQPSWLLQSSHMPGCGMERLLRSGGKLHPQSGRGSLHPCTACEGHAADAGYRFPNVCPPPHRATFRHSGIRSCH